MPTIILPTGSPPARTSQRAVKDREPNAMQIDILLGEEEDEAETSQDELSAEQLLTQKQKQEQSRKWTLEQRSP